jgi:hypothetical protein
VDAGVRARNRFGEVVAASGDRQDASAGCHDPAAALRRARVLDGDAGDCLCRIEAIDRLP